jgi:hypothetical protein
MQKPMSFPHIPATDPEDAPPDDSSTVVWFRGRVCSLSSAEVQKGMVFNMIKTYILKQARRGISKHNRVGVYLSSIMQLLMD